MNNAYCLIIDKVNQFEIVHYTDIKQFTRKELEEAYNLIQENNKNIVVIDNHTATYIYHKKEEVRRPKSHCKDMKQTLHHYFCRQFLEENMPKHEMKPEDIKF